MVDTRLSGEREDQAILVAADVPALQSGQAEAAVLVGVDTGLTHMAVALGRPTISLMGYTNPKRTGPYRRVHDLIVDAYGDPGEDYPLSMENRPGRMTRIRVRDVLDRVEHWRNSYARPSTSSGPNA